MPLLRADPSADTLRKRESRARLRAANPEDYLAKNATQAKSWRAAVKLRKEADAIVIPDGIDVSGYIDKINEHRSNLTSSIAKIVSDSLPINACAERILEMTPIIETRIAAVANVAALKIETISNDADLASRVKAWADSEFHAGNAKSIITLKTFQSYVQRLAYLQFLITGKKSPLDMRNFIDHVRIMLLINTTKMGNGKLWSLGNRVSYLTALSNISNKFKALVDAHKIYLGEFLTAKTQQDNERSQNKSTPEEIAKFVHWPVIAARMKSIAQTSEFTARQVALMSIYVDIPPRRALDYSEMFVTMNKDPTDKSKNWMVIDLTNRPTKMIINV